MTPLQPTSPNGLGLPGAASLPVRHTSLPVIITGRHTTLSGGIPDVVGLGPLKQVGWVNTRRVVTSMQDTVTGWSVVYVPGQSMDQDQTITTAAKIYLPVATFHSESLPLPTVVGASHINPSPKSVL